VPIVDQALWDDVQTKLAGNAVERRSGERTKNPSLLGGLLFDGDSHRMTPSHANKNGTRYRYYVSRPLISQSRAAAPQALRIPAAEIEQLVIARLGQFFSEPARIADALPVQIETAAEQRHLLQRAAELSANWPALTAVRRRRIIAALVDRIVVAVDRVEFHLLPSHLAAVLRDASSQPIAARPAEQHEQPILLSVPAQFRRAGLGIRMLVEEGALPGWAAKADPKLVKLIARAHLFHQKLVESTSEYLDEVARGLGFTSSYLTRLLRLTYLAPDITRAILDGRHPRDFTAQKLLSHSRLPLGWPEQRRILGFA
jgi:site-specific DNA recombinase